MKLIEGTNKVKLTEEEYYTFSAAAKKNGTTINEEIDRFLIETVKKFEALDLTDDDMEMLKILYDLSQKSGV